MEKMDIDGIDPSNIIMPVSGYYQNPNPNKMNLPPNQMKPLFTKKDDKIINRANFEKLLNEKLNRDGLQIKNTQYNEIINSINNGLDIYLRNILEKLIIITRSKNVNLNLYSKLSEKNPVFKIHTFNWDRQINNIGQNIIEFTPYKDFSIMFTKNMKNTINTLETYEDLNYYKSKYEKLSSYKNKLEEIQSLKEKEKEKGTGGGTVQTPKTVNVVPVVHSVGRRRKRDTTILKNYKRTIVKNQKKEELDRHKKDTQNTLEAFLDNKPKVKETLSNFKFDTEIGSNIAESHNLETYTKLSEISKSENPAIINTDSNELNLNIFKNYIPSQNLKLFTGVKRRISLKDLIFYLENERRTPLQNLILHKAVLKLQQSH
jgi:hypothetical protein